MTKMYKKAQFIGEVVSLSATALIVVALLLVFFFIVKGFNLSGSNVGDAREISMNQSSLISLESYVNTPVNIQYGGENITILMADLIRLSGIDEDYRDMLKQKSKEIFDRVYGGDYYLSAFYNGSEVLSIGNQFAEQKTQLSLSNVEINLYLLKK